MQTPATCQDLQLEPCETSAHQNPQVSITFEGTAAADQEVEGQASLKVAENMNLNQNLCLFGL